MRQMRRHFVAAVMLAAGLALVPAATVKAATPGAKRVNVTGEIIDTWCYVSQIMFAEGTAHYQCATWCAIGGIPVSIKDEDDNVYVILRIESDERNVANPTIVRIQAHQVTVEGDLIERDGVKYLLVTQVANDEGIINLTHEFVDIQPFGK